MKRKIISSVITTMLFLASLCGCSNTEMEKEAINITDQIESQENEDESNINTATESSKEHEKVAEINMESQSESSKETETKQENTQQASTANKEDIYYGGYDETKLQYVTYISPAWFVLQIVDNQYIRLMEPVKGDARCIIINDKGEAICEGITDSMYGDTYISKYEGETVVVNFYDIDDEQMTQRVGIVDMEGNVVADFQESIDDSYEEDEWEDEEVSTEEYPYLEGDDIGIKKENEKISLEIDNEGVTVKDSAGEQVGFFKNANPDYQPKRDDKITALYGEIRGNFLFIYQITPVDSADWDDDAVWIYKIL